MSKFKETPGGGIVIGVAIGLLVWAVVLGAIWWATR